jgi:hypothetical protein
MNELKPDKNPAEKLFYKYRPINQHLFDTLKYNELYFRDPRDYNDPIDSVMALHYEGTYEEMVDYIVENSKDGRDKIMEEVDTGIIWDKCQMTGNKLRVEMSYENILYKILPLPLTYCLSKKPDEMLMWSHYADEHKGACLSFKSKYGVISEEDFTGYKLTIDSESMPIREIKYKKRMPSSVNLLDKNLSRRSIRLSKFLLTKGACWRYEEEHRMLLVDKESTAKERPKTKNCKFEKTELEGVIFGLRAKYCDAYKVHKIVEKHYINKGMPINFYRALKVNNEYSVKIKPICETGIDEYLESLYD